MSEPMGQDPNHKPGDGVITARLEAKLAAIKGAPAFGSAQHVASIEAKG